MSPHALKLGESLEAYETRLKLQHEARQRDVIMTMPEHEYRRRVAEASAPIKREPTALPDVRDMTDEQFESAKYAIGIHRQSVR
jgi:hypothetical protein